MFDKSYNLSAVYTQTYIGKMVVSNELVVFFLLLIVSQVSAQNYYAPSITCYTQYEYEETKNQASNSVLGYAFSQAEITHYSTSEGELCSNVGCACFSYRSACSHSSHGPNHYSQCTDTDRHNRVVKWHRGFTSLSKCEQMRQQPQTYADLTCCHTDRCNDQPGKIIKIVDSNIQPQRYNTYVYPTASYISEVEKSPLQTSNALSSVAFSNWIICFALLFRLIIIMQSY